MGFGLVGSPVSVYVPITTVINHRMRLKLDFLAEIYRLQETASLAETITRELPKLIPCDNVMIGGHDGTRRVMTGIALRHPFTRMNFLAEANHSTLMGLHPFWEKILAPGDPVKVLSEMAPGRRWLENPFYREVLREDRVRDHLNVEFGASPADFTSVSLIRSTVGFNQTDRQSLRLLHPHFQQAFANARLMEQGSRHPALPQRESISSISLNDRGHCIDRDAGMRLASSLGSPTGRLPDRLQRWLDVSIDDLNRGLNGHASLQIRIGARACFLQIRRDWSARCYRLHYRASSGAGELLGQPLSTKENEILHWVREGKSNAEIAILTGISPETVKTHLKRTFRKLGVENRTAAANHSA